MRFTVIFILCLIPLSYGYVLTKTMVAELLEDELNATYSLGLYSEGITSVDSDALEGFVHLKTLDLSHNALHEINVPTFDDLRSLVELNIGYNSLKSIDSALFRNLASLEKLELRVNSLSSLSADTFNALPSLLHLDLGHNELEGFQAGTFAALKQLKYLNLDHNLIKSFDFTLLAGLKRLDELVLSYNQIKAIETSELNKLSIRKVKFLNNPVEKYLSFVNGTAVLEADLIGAARLEAAISGANPVVGVAAKVQLMYGMTGLFISFSSVFRHIIH